MKPMLTIVCVSAIFLPRAAVSADDGIRTELRLKSLKAVLIYNSGRLGERDITTAENNPRQGIPEELLNTLIGEGNAQGDPSDAMLVFVEVEAPHYTAKVRGSLQLTATALGKSPLQKRESLAVESIGLPGPQGTTIIPFLVRRVGCRHIELTALATQKKPGAKKAETTTLTRFVPFECND